MSRWLSILVVASGFTGVAGAQEQVDRLSSPESTPTQSFLERHCLECHSSEAKAGGLALDTISLDAVNQHPNVWEKVVRKLVARQMPPAKKPRPNEEAYEAGVAFARELARCRGRRAS